MEIDLKMTP